MNRVNLQDGPLNDVERDRMEAILSRFHSEDAMHNAEEVDMGRNEAIERP